MSRTLQPLAAVAIVGLIGAGCSNGSAENGNSGTASNTGTASNQRATDQDKIASVLGGVVALNGGVAALGGVVALTGGVAALAGANNLADDLRTPMSSRE
ncbi:MAG: hypothetical protein ACRDPU_06025, partial [Thermoleophilia bacterium]